MIQKLLLTSFLFFFVVNVQGLFDDDPIQQDNPDQHLNPLEMAVSHGYPAEAHVVRTSDGYLLTMHRIPCGRAGCRNGRGRGQPVLLKHGVLSSSADWLVIGPEKGLGYLLADAGYDVWMGNARGNTYSRKHIHLRNMDSKFWDFTPHDMALYDVPAEIDYIYSYKFQESNRTEKDLLYVGYSIGTTTFFACLSMMPEYNEKVKAMFALAPVVYWTNVRSPIRFLAPYSKSLLVMSYLLGPGELAPQNWLTRTLALEVCGTPGITEEICMNLNFVLMGYNRKQVNETLLPVILSHSPAGTSSKTITNAAQQMLNGAVFRAFDYGVLENVPRYGSPEPPVYNLDNVKVPVSLFYSDNDWIASHEDVLMLYNNLKKNGTRTKLHRVILGSFNHVDFMYGIDVKDLVYDYLIDSMLNFT